MGYGNIVLISKNGTLLNFNFIYPTDKFITLQNSPPYEHITLSKNSLRKVKIILSIRSSPIRPSVKSNEWTTMTTTKETTKQNYNISFSFLLPQPTNNRPT